MDDSYTAKIVISQVWSGQGFLKQDNTTHKYTKTLRIERDHNL